MPVVPYYLGRPAHLWLDVTSRAETRHHHSPARPAEDSIARGRREAAANLSAAI